MPIRNTSALDLRNLHRFLGPVVPGPGYQFLPSHTKPGEDSGTLTYRSDGTQQYCV